MAPAASYDIALMSLRPRFAKAILLGTKRVEFRKRPFSRPIRFALIYATKPIGKVVGAFEIQAVNVASPSVLWERYRDVGGVHRDELEAYYHNAEAGVAIEIGHMWDLCPGVDLTDLGLAERPPQSYSYASLASLLDHTSSGHIHSVLTQMWSVGHELPSSCD